MTITTATPSICASRHFHRLMIGAVSMLAAGGILMAVSTPASAMKWIPFTVLFKKNCAANGGKFSGGGDSVSCAYGGGYGTVTCTPKYCNVAF